MGEEAVKVEPSNMGKMYEVWAMAPIDGAEWVLMDTAFCEEEALSLAESFEGMGYYVSVLAFAIDE